MFPPRHIEIDSLVGRADVLPIQGRISVGDLSVSTDRDDTRATALLAHIGELTKATQQLQTSTISFINFAGLISAGALTVGITQSKPLIGIFAPYALTVALAFLLQLYTDIERLITLREFVEGHLNGALNAPAYLGINIFSSRHRNRISVRLVAVLLAIPLLGIGFYSIKQTSSTHPHWHGINLHWVNVFGLTFCVIVLVWAATEMFRARSHAIEEAQATLGVIPAASNVQPRT